MWVLQEYRFYLIIAVIALAGIIFLFFRTQTSQGVADFSTELKSNYAQIKGQAASTKSLYDVVTIDGEIFRGMKANQLFGMTYRSEVPGDMAASRLLIEPGVDLGTLPGTAVSNTFEVVFRTGTDANDNGVNTDVFTGADVATAPSDNPALRGWNLESGWDTIFIFHNAAEAQKVMIDYLPEGTLEGATVTVPFLSN